MPEATMDAGEEPKQAIPAHPALTALYIRVRQMPEASRLNQSIPASFSTGEGVNYQRVTIGFHFPLPPNLHPADLFIDSLTLKRLRHRRKRIKDR